MNKSIISYSLLTISLVILPFTRVKSDMDMYGTHMRCLFAAVISTTGPVLELGSGHYSTPLLHVLCSQKERLLVSTETDLNWLNKFKKRYERPWHQFVYVPVFGGRSVNPDAWFEVGKDMNWLCCTCRSRADLYESKNDRTLKTSYKNICSA